MFFFIITHIYFQEKFHIFISVVEYDCNIFVVIHSCALNKSKNQFEEKLQKKKKIVPFDDYLILKILEYVL